MLLRERQVSRFWREWSGICRANGWTGAEAEAQRKLMLGRAGFNSLTKVDHMAGFDRVLAEMAALSRPDDLEAQLRLATMDRTRVIYAIKKLAHQIVPTLVDSFAFGSPYAASLLRDRFGHGDPDRLSLAELEQVRNTLTARLAAKRREAKATAAVPAENCAW